MYLFYNDGRIYKNICSYRKDTSRKGMEELKYIIVLGDGMSGLPLETLGGQTTLEYARTPAMDLLAGKGEVGLACMVPPDMKPGSDVANLSVLGYDPAKCYTGRSPLEALSIGVPMEASDAIYRCNLVTLTEDEPYPRKRILDHSAGEISTQEAAQLIQAVKEEFAGEPLRFYTGTSYRHIAVWKNGGVLEMEAPHDHLGEVIEDCLPRHKMFREIMERSYAVLNEHPINLRREKEGKGKANSLWFWGGGVRPELESFYAKTGLRGAMISAVDLLKGIAVGTGMEVITVLGANGSLDTNYAGKAAAGLDALLNRDMDLAFIHVEAPDEMGHQGSVPHKIQSIEEIDRKIVGPMYEAMQASGIPFRMLVLPDHPTPISLRTHTKEPVPYVLYDSTRERKKIGCYNEKEGEASGIYFPEGFRLMERLTER